MVPDKEIGANVRDRRQALGLTGSQLAKTLGVSQATVSELERGIREWKTGQVIAFAEALGCLPGDLLPASLRRLSEEGGPPVGASLDGDGGVLIALARQQLTTQQQIAKLLAEVAEAVKREG